MDHITNEKELKVIYGSQKSFNRKAIVKTDKNDRGTYYSLFSYGTFIIELKENEKGEKFINAITENENHFTNTTLKHLNEFMLQNGIESHNKREWLEIWINQKNYDY